MSNAKLLKKLSRKVITLSQVDPETGEPLSVTIRKVKAGEVNARVGKPMSLMGALRDFDPDETPEERRKRVMHVLTDDPEMLEESMRYGEEVKRAVLCLGVTSELVVDKSQHELTDIELCPEDFGDDFGMLYNAILEFSDLPFQPEKVADLSRFRQDGVAEDLQPAGQVLREAASRN